MYNKYNNCSKRQVIDMSQYQGIAHACTAKLDLREEEAAAILKAYDFGLDDLDNEQRQALYVVLAKLKDQIWP